MQDKILEMLADRQFHSGEELGLAMGVSRTAVWKQLKRLEDLGVALESVKGKGYRLASAIHLLNQDAIEAGLNAEVSSYIDGIEISKIIDSTNTRALARAVAEPGCYVCASEHQTAGRGRRGRRWHSPFASNLYFSVSRSFDNGAAVLEGLSLAVGVALSQALDDFGFPGVRLKWPNDVVYDGKKLAGILLEMTGDADGPCCVVVGVGLNVAMAVAADIDQPWIDLSSIDGAAEVNRNALLAVILNRLVALLRDYDTAGFSAYQTQWQQLDAFAGCAVVIKMADRQVSGYARGVESDGALVIETSAGFEVFSGGEVSLRGADDS